MINSALLVLALVAASQTEGGDAKASLDAIVESARRFVPAKVIERTAPKYPGPELTKGNEAWVHVSYCIDESGRTQNVAVLDSVGRQRFDQAAIRAVEKWTFEPAQVDSSPSWQSRNQAYVIFALQGGERSASPKFVRAYKKLSRLLEGNKLTEADALFKRVFDTYDLSLYALSKLWAQRVRYEGLVGDMYGMDRALHRAMASKGEWIGKDDYYRLLNLRIKVEISLGHYNAAIEGFEELAGSAGEGSEDVQSLKPLIDNLHDVIRSDELFKIEAMVRTRDECDGCGNSWSFTPVRNTFALANISGNLTSVEMRCDHKRFASSVSDSVEWTIPESWGSCHVSFYGDSGTTFDVVMMPSST